MYQVSESAGHQEICVTLTVETGKSIEVMVNTLDSGSAQGNELPCV